MCVRAFCYTYVRMARGTLRSGQRRLEDGGEPGLSCKVTTVRLEESQWRWLRDQAHRRALERGTRADASEIVRELVAAAMRA